MAEADGHRHPVAQGLLQETRAELADARQGVRAVAAARLEHQCLAQVKDGAQARFDGRSALYGPVDRELDDLLLPRLL